jgi:hypothetical protein
MRYETARYLTEGSAALAPTHSCTTKNGTIITFDEARASYGRQSAQSKRRPHFKTPQWYRDLTNGTLAGTPAENSSKRQVIGIGAGYTLAAALVLALGVVL